ncbi:MAG: carbamoyl-phosphate synthase large subunit, partial [Pseudomonadota bacterium]
MNKKLRVLVFPCGSENAAEIHQALRYSLHVELFGASSVDDHGRFRFERYVGGLPKISDAEFDSTFSRLLVELDI